MDSRTVRTLNDLIRIELDTLHAYAYAGQRVHSPALARDLDWFRRDYERHVGKLVSAVQRLGGTPARPRRDTKGLFMRGVTALRSATSIDGALKAVQTSEERINARYDQALLVCLPDDIMALLFSNRADARRHLNHVDHALSARRQDLPRSQTQPSA